MGALLAGILAMAILLLVIGLGWHVVWNGLTKGAVTVKDVILQMINYYSDVTPSGSSDHSPVSHSKGFNKA